MLRLFLGLSLTIAGLGLLRPPACFPPPDPPAAQKIIARGQLPREVKGYGLTADEAREDAVRQAARELADLLHRQEPPLAVAGDEEATRHRLAEYVRAYLIAGPGQQLADVPDVAKDKAAKVWSLPLRAEPNLDAIIRSEQAEQRHLLGRARQFLAGWIVAGLATLIGTLGGALRLVQWSRSHLSAFTRTRMAPWVKLAIITLLGAVLASLLVIG